ncbi:MAG: competence protein CoiA family protein [Syntrophomonadaceae bacterium]|jgi:competence CoiA-like predicted nuclease|nr:competence protein CoiA family protein [Syntrophomonadaceae bacterium]
MLTALLNENRILATDPAWDDSRDEYRIVFNEKAVCPICKGPITCKFGQVKQHHFAHRHTSDCPGSKDSVEHMQGKALLYEFLKARYQDQAKIEIEPFFGEINQVGDILLEFGDGSRWAFEFACGIKKKDLEEKIRFYDRQGIDVTCIIPRNLLETLNEKQVRVARREQLLICKTGIDKLYMGDWYKQIVAKKRRMALPTHWDSKGSLLALDVENRELNILRAIRPDTHHNVFEYGASIQGPLDDVKITAHGKWGRVFYFAKEEDLKPKFIEAERILAELEEQLQAKEKARVEAEAQWQEPNGPGKSPNIYSFISWRDLNKQFDQRPGSVKATGTKRHICPKCQQEFSLRDVVPVTRSSVSQGKCPWCGREKPRI